MSRRQHPFPTGPSQAAKDAIKDLEFGRNIERTKHVSVTHYIPELTPIFRGKKPDRHLAACGLKVPLKQHSAEPTCPECKAFVDRDPFKGKKAEELF